jgi:hypothetical protein
MLKSERLKMNEQDFGNIYALLPATEQKVRSGFTVPLKYISTDTESAATV